MLSIEKNSEATSDLSEKECCEQLAMSVISQGQGSGVQEYLVSKVGVNSDKWCSSRGTYCVR